MEKNSKHDKDTPMKQVDFKKPETYSKPGQRHPGNDSPMSAFTLIGQLGLVIALCIVVAVAVGIYLDRLVGSNGILTFVMIIVGLAAAGFSAWTLIKQELPWNH